MIQTGSNPNRSSSVRAAWRLAPRLAVVIALTGVNSAASAADNDRIAMGALSAAYVVNAIHGARLAIRDDLHEAPFGVRSNRPVKREFLAGTGTAFSPGLPMLVTQVASTVLAFQTDGTARTGALLLAIHGGGYFVGGMAEPETYRTLRHPRRAGVAKVIAVIGELAIPPVLAVQAMRVRDDR